MIPVSQNSAPGNGVTCSPDAIEASSMPGRSTANELKQGVSQPVWQDVIKRAFPLGAARDSQHRQDFPLGSFSVRAVPRWYPTLATPIKRPACPQPQLGPYPAEERTESPHFTRLARIVHTRIM